MYTGISRRQLLLGILPTASLMAPGVYVEELRTGPSPITPADGTTAGLVGLVAAASTTIKGGGIAADRAVSSYAEFTAAYGRLV